MHDVGSVMAWACMAASGTGSLIFIDDGTHDGSSGMNSEVYRNNRSSSLQRNASDVLGRTFIVEQDQKHCQHNKGLLQGGKVEGFRLSTSITRPSPSSTFHFPKRRLKVYIYS